MAKQRPLNRVVRWASPACLCVMCLSLLSSPVNAEIEGLFSDAGEALSLEAPSSHDIPSIQRRIVRMDFGQLHAARKEVLAGRPAHLALNLFDEVAFRAIVERTAPTSSGYSLSGRLEGIPFGTMALVLNDTVVTGKVRTLDAVYTIRTAGGGTYTIQRVQPTEFTEAPPLKPPPRTSDVDPRTHARVIEEDDGSEIDILVVWTRTGRRDAGGTRHIKASIDLAVVETNYAFATSGATQRIRLVGAVEVDYDEPGGGGMETHLHRLVNPYDGFLDDVHTLRDSYAADLVHLALGVHCNMYADAGVAHTMVDPSPSFESSAFSASIFCDDNRDGGALSSRMFAHELGHNMGLQHDRYARDTTLNKPYPFSHGYVNQRAFEAGATRDARWRTMMSHNDQCSDAGFDCPRLLRFSNPKQLYPAADGHPLGIPGDDPSEEVDGPADAVRSLDNTRRIVANFRSSASRCTYRLAEEAVTVPAAGGAFSIDVEAGLDCAYTARSHDEHLSVTSGWSSGGDGTLRFQVAANEGGARVGSISVAGETLLVSQSGIHAVASVCGRTPAIRDAIMAWSGRDHCNDVTEFDLSEIPYLVLVQRGITELREGDFTGLSSLQRFSLRLNPLTGEIPPELGQLSNLELLDLSGNRLSGSIPPELGQLSNLETLLLSDNRLSGSIPPELGQLTKLTLLSLSRNRLTGSIPSELGQLTRVRILVLAANRLTGNIPVELGRLTKVVILDLWANRLTGNIPLELGNIPRLWKLDLYGNQLTGPIPAELSLSENLQILHLSRNPLTGCIPGALKDVADNDLDLLGLGYCAAVSIANGGHPSAPPELGRIREGTAATLTILADPPQETAFDVTVMVSGGEAFGVTMGNRTVTIPSDANETTLTVNTADNDIDESNGAFTATILTDTDYALFASRSSASIIIDDDEGPSAPTISSLTPEDGRLTVTWTAPQDGGSVTAYDLRHRPSPPAQGWQTWTLIDSATMGALQRDITGLTNRVEYDIQVRAVNDDGDGAWSEIARGTPGECPEGIELGDCRTLLAVRDTLVGGGTAINWATSLPIEEWTGIEVHRFTGRVVELRLSDQGLSGTIPAELGSLTELTVLSLPNNGLTGMIPPQLGNLKRLQELWLSNNRLTGMIPPQLGNLKRLQELWLSNNRLTGTIPPELGNVPYLQYLSLSQNELTGTIPPELGRLRNLDWLLLGNNRLTGPIPAELAGLAKLVTLWLHDNELTGPIPAALGRLSKLRQLLLYNNQLTGSIPPELGRLTNLTALRLSDNQLTGSIPRSLPKLTNLISLFLAGNRLTGCVPASLRDVDRSDLHRLALPDCPPASVIDLVIESIPLDGRAYGTGERIEISVRFETDVTVSGFPQLALTIGSGVHAAAFIANQGNGQLAFRYAVEPAARDSDGISIAPDALALNGGRIRDIDGKHAVLDLGEHAIANHPSHQVRGALRELVPDQDMEAGGETLTLDLSRYFNFPEGGTLTYGTPISSDPSVATAIIEDGLLKVMPLEDGITTITVTATDDTGITVTLSFRVAVTAIMRGLRPWLMGILVEQAAREAEEPEDNDPQ